MSELKDKKAEVRTETMFVDFFVVNKLLLAVFCCCSGFSGYMGRPLSLLLESLESLES